MPITKNDIPFKTVIDALKDPSSAFPGIYLSRFSDMQPTDLALLKEIWPTVKVKKRLSLVESLIKLHEQDTLVCFDDVGAMILSDEDPRLRIAAIRLLRESEDHRLISKFLRILDSDPQVLVRAAAAGALSIFVLQGELEKISPAKYQQIQQALFPRITGTDDDLIRRSALEAMGYSSRKEMDHLIYEAFEESDPDWVASAVVAMGRSASDDWEMRILRSLYHPDVIVRLEAIRAAGLLTLTRALEPLLEMLDTGLGMTQELRRAAIWTLSELGGEKAGAALESLLESAESDEEADFIDEAIENLNFGNAGLDLGIIDLDTLRPSDAFLYENDTGEEEDDELDNDLDDENYDDEKDDEEDDYYASNDQEEDSWTDEESNVKRNKGQQ